MRLANKSSKAIARARELRQNLSDTERKLWYKIRAHRLGFHFRRQCPIGPYFLDFYCDEAKLCVEIDGEQHADRAAQDRVRDHYLERLGILTYRIPSLDFFTDPSSYLYRIYDLCRERSGSNPLNVD